MPDTPQDATHEEDETPETRWPVWAAAALEALSVSPTIRNAASRAGVDRRTLQRLIQRDERFALAVHDARENALDSIEETIILRARSGQPVKRTTTKTDKDGGVVETTTVDETHISDNLAMFYLKRWRPEYRDTYRVEQSGPGGGAIQVDVEVRLADAVGFFDAEVVRLAATGGAGEAPDGSGGASGPVGS